VDKAQGYRYRIIESYGARLADDKLMLSSLPNGCRVKCDLRDQVQRQIWFYGAYEPIESYLFTQLLSPGMVVIDAGANVGQYSMLAATGVGPSGSVHSFEPIPSNFARLREHIDNNCLSNVFLSQCALWREETSLILGMPSRMINNAGAYSVRAGYDPASLVEAQAISLDAYVAKQELSRVDLIKMDIEGAEPFALIGGLNLIEKFKPTILMEINQEALHGAGSSTAMLWETVSAMGYRVWRIGQSPETSGPVADLEGFTQSNALLYQTELPASVKSGWSYGKALRWARSGL
jgi:FkbM family methyltransferase